MSQRQVTNVPVLSVHVYGKPPLRRRRYSLVARVLEEGVAFTLECSDEPPIPLTREAVKAPHETFRLANPGDDIQGAVAELLSAKWVFEVGTRFRNERTWCERLYGKYTDAEKHANTLLRTYGGTSETLIRPRQVL